MCGKGGGEKIVELREIARFSPAKAENLKTFGGKAAIKFKLHMEKNHK